MGTSHNSTTPLAVPTPPTQHQPLVGRQAELERLQDWYARACRGERCIGMITGEAGIGKTALVETFAASLEREGVVSIGRGQCIDQ